MSLRSYLSYSAYLGPFKFREKPVIRIYPQSCLHLFTGRVVFFYLIFFKALGNYELSVPILQMGELEQCG